MQRPIKPNRRRRASGRSARQLGGIEIARNTQFMALRFAEIAALAGVALCCGRLGGGTVDTVAQNGKFRELKFPGQFRGNRVVLESVATADEQFVLHSTTGHGPVTFVTDAEGELIHTGSSAKCCDVSATKSLALFLYASRFDLVSVPSLEVVASVSDENQSSDIQSSLLDCVAIRPTRSGWIYVAIGGQVTKLDSNPLRFAATTRLPLRSVMAADTDPDAGLLVATGDENHVLIYDMDRGSLIARSEFSDSRFYYDVRTHGGVVWIGTRDGEILRLRAKSLELIGKTVLTQGKAKVRTDLSRSGKLLVAGAYGAKQTDGHPAVLTVYRVVGEDLVEHCSWRTKLPYRLTDLTILEKRESVIVSTHGTQLLWQYGEQKRADGYGAKAKTAVVYRSRHIRRGAGDALLGGEH